jgi:nucleoside-diphosphate-sugar epimerase
MARILVTGSRGLIGKALTRRLEEIGHSIVCYDISDDENNDILDADGLRSAVASCTGIVHLAAVSRVIHGERNPKRCRTVNIDGTRNVLTAAAQAGKRQPWVIYGSSREVYGQSEDLPVRESAQLRPMNVYARSKVDAERLVLSSREQAGLRASIVRFSSVYGSIIDHKDRVVPAFARKAVLGDTLSVEGSNNVLDFTHVDDVINGLVKMIGLMAEGEIIPTVHLTSGQGTTLMELASLAIRFAGSGTISVAAPRPYDVSAFIGDPTLAREVLNWNASIPLPEGISRLVASFASNECP